MALITAIDHARRAVAAVARFLIHRFYYGPVFTGRCVRSGRGLRVHGLPHVMGHTHIYIGENVTIDRRCGIMSGRVFDDPTLILEDGVVIGERVGFSINKRVVIGAGTEIGPGCYFADNDGHPRDPAARVSGAPPAPEDILPITVGRNVRIGAGTYIMKGATIGDGAVIARKSVILGDVPPGSVFGGNPAMPLSGAR